MLKYIAKLESIVENRIGHFMLEHDCPVHVAKEMCFQFLKFLGQIEDAAKVQVDQANEKPVTEESPVDETGMPPEQTNVD